jgi:hypothetical protein
VAYLENRGLWARIDEVVWAHEDDNASPGMLLCQKLGVERAPFFIVRDSRGEAVYCSVLQLVRERLDLRVTAFEQAAAIDADDIGGI